MPVGVGYGVPSGPGQMKNGRPVGGPGQMKYGRPVGYAKGVKHPNGIRGRAVGSDTGTGYGSTGLNVYVSGDV